MRRLLAAVAPGVHADPGGQLRGNVQDQLAVGDQPLGQRPAGTAAAFHRPAAVLPPAGEARQPRVALVAVGEPGRLDQGLGHRAGTAAVLLALCGPAAIITSSLMTSSSYRGGPGEGGSATSGRAE